MVPLIAWIGSLPGAHRVLDRLGDLGENAARPRPLGVLAVEELDVVEDLVAALIAQRVEQPADALLEQIVHRNAYLPSMPETTDTSSATGVVRNLVRAARMVTRSTSSCSGGSARNSAACAAG